MRSRENTYYDRESTLENEKNTQTRKQDRVLTAQGLTLKGMEKIQRINCDASQKDVLLRTWQLSRIVRRDFNLLSYKLFFALRRREVAQRVRRALDDLVEEADVLANMTRKEKLPTPDESTLLNLRIVNADCDRLIDALITADRALAKMKESDMAEVADDNCSRFYIAYARLKNILLAAKPN